MTHDIAVVGAGPVGMTFALALREADLDVVVIDGRTSGVTTRADRSLALSHGARLILERLGIWTPLAASAGAITPIVTIDISQARGFGAVRLDASEHGLPALGYVVSYQALQQTLDDALRQSGIELRFGAVARAVTGAAAAATIEITGRPDEPVQARLAVAADGAASIVRGVDRRRHDYEQVAIVATIALDHPHRGVAFERFASGGPIALLPEREHYALIWTQRPDAAARTLALTETAFIAELGAHFGSRRGGFAQARDRRTFPLTLEVARSTTSQRVAVIGNAAQSLHPIAGQGFNLGVRDAHELASIVLSTPRAALGAGPMLERYARRRAWDRRAGIAFTHGLVQLFGTDSTWLSLPRGLGLMLLDTLPFAKHAFTRAMLFGMR